MSLLADECSAGHVHTTPTGCTRVDLHQAHSCTATFATDKPVHFTYVQHKHAMCESVEWTNLRTS